MTMRVCESCGGSFSPTRKGDRDCQRCVRPIHDFTAGRLIVVHSEFPAEYDGLLKALSREGFSLTRPHETTVPSDALASLFQLANRTEADGRDAPAAAEFVAAINRLRIT